MPSRRRCASKWRSWHFLRDLQFAQAADFPTLDINIDRERAGQFGLTMADVVRSVVPATSSSRFTAAELLARSELRKCVPDSGGTAAESHAERGRRRQRAGDAGRRSDTRLTDVATLKLGTMPGLIERYNGQHIVSLTANIHGITLGEAARKLNRALAAAGAPPRGVSVKMRGEIPALEQTLSGLRTGLASRVLVILLLLSANFQSFRLALAIVLTIPAVLCGCSADAADHGDDVERAVVHGRDHGDWNRGGELDSAGHLRGTGAA